MLDERRLHAAADKLYATGLHHSWWKDLPDDWRKLDPIGREEFLDVTAAIVKAYLTGTKG